MEGWTLSKRCRTGTVRYVTGSWVQLQNAILHLQPASLILQMFPINGHSNSPSVKRALHLLRYDYAAHKHCLPLIYVRLDYVIHVHTQVKTLHKHKHIQNNTQTNLYLRSTTLGYGFHFQHRNPRTLPVNSTAHDSEQTLVRAEYRYPKESPHTTVKEEIRRYSSQYSARLSAHPNGLVVNLIDLRQQAIAETPAKWSAYQIPSVIVVSVILVCKV
jgi:hypothetical protein